jgi:ABC-type transport system involved in multi-copper enzyme maturation permease subunit
VTVLLAKPAPRWAILAGKYLGVVLFVALHATLFVGGTWLGMGVATGYLGAAPSVVWASGWFFAAAFVFLIPVAIWIYTLVFAFSSLWFTHYALAALEQLRAGAPGQPLAVPDGAASLGHPMIP